ncbi:MAG: cytochrome c [Campylobacterota bacterium]|nr:cytochrome c [Campylobacterota bacterium]
MNKLLTALVLTFSIVATLQAQSGKKVFETYCWGCHHQTAVAFGPPFTEIASRRSADEIRGMITDPASVSKVFGYKRSAMPPFKLTKEEMDAITAYVLTFKPEMKEK